MTCLYISNRPIIIGQLLKYCVTRALGHSLLHWHHRKYESELIDTLINADAGCMPLVCWFTYILSYKSSCICETFRSEHQVELKEPAFQRLMRLAVDNVLSWPPETNNYYYNYMSKGSNNVTQNIEIKFYCPYILRVVD